MAQSSSGFFVVQPNHPDRSLPLNNALKPFGGWLFSWAMAQVYVLLNASTKRRGRRCFTKSSFVRGKTLGCADVPS